MHFGLYLKRKGIITAEQLVAAIEAQLDTLVPIGQIALEEGILSAQDIFTILRAQSDSPHERFGELAIELGLMTREELMRLLMLQTDRKRPLAEILVRQGVLTERQSAAEMSAFRRDKLQPRTTVTRAKLSSTRRARSRVVLNADSAISS
jgi:hypothetical protein